MSPQGDFASSLLSYVFCFASNTTYMRSQGCPWPVAHAMAIFTLNTAIAAALSSRRRRAFLAVVAQEKRQK